jgi:hypothetical protein
VSEYSRDEALRITGLVVMLEDHTYTFAVRNTNGRFLLTLEKHEFPKGFFEDCGKYCVNVKDPCAAESRDIKDAAWKSIATHKKLAHHLKVVS